LDAVSEKQVNLESFNVEEFQNPLKRLNFAKKYKL